MPKVTAIVSKVTNRISLVQGHEYEVIGIEDTYIRIIDESREPVLYPKPYFLDCEISPPSGWVRHEFEEGQYEIVPLELAARAFFENYADKRPIALRAFQDYLEKLED